MRLAAFISCLFSLTGLGAVIPADRVVDWAGYPPGPKGGTIARSAILNVKTGYGAVGDGVADDYLAIKNAIAAAATNDVVYFPAGRYRLTNTVTLKSGITLRGDGPSASVLVGAHNHRNWIVITNTPVADSIFWINGETRRWALTNGWDTIATTNDVNMSATNLLAQLVSFPLTNQVYADWGFYGRTNRFELGMPCTEPPLGKYGTSTNYFGDGAAYYSQLTNADGTAYGYLDPPSLVVGGNMVILGTADAVIGNNSNNLVSATSIKGSTNLSLWTTNGIIPGTIVLIDQDNDPSVGASGPLTSYLSRLGGSRLMGQFAEVLTVSDTNITITPALAWHYTNAGQITPLTTYTRHVGLEHLSITNANAYDPEDGQKTVNATGWVDCWCTNVVSWRCSTFHWFIHRCFRSAWQECAVYYATTYQSSRAYGFDVGYQSTACLVENCIAWTRTPYVIEGAGPYNVFGYNYFAGGMNDSGLNGSFDLNHGSCPHFNLWEGNVGTKITGDWYHGGSWSETVFRNWLKGWQPNPSGTNPLYFIPNQTNYYQGCVSLFVSNYNHNIVGNVLGDPAFFNRGNTYYTNWTYYALTNNSNSERPYIWRLGFIGVGFGIDNWDAGVSNLTLRTGNFDYTNNATIWDINGVQALPSSYYLASKPGWFSNAVWPPIGPDVTPMTNMIPAQMRYLGLDYSNPIPAPRASTVGRFKIGTLKVAP